MKRLGISDVLFGCDISKKPTDQQNSQPLPCKNPSSKDASCISGNSSFLAKLAMFESLENKKVYHKAEIRRPSMLKEFQREKLEKICRNRINDQLKNQQGLDLRANFEFVKNYKTGEYELDKETEMNLRNEASSFLKNSSTVKSIIEQFEQNGSENKSNRLPSGVPRSLWKM